MPLPLHQKLTHLQSLDPPTHQKTDIGFQSIINLKNSNSFFKRVFVIFADIEEKFKTIFHKPSLLPYTYTVSSNIYFWYFRNESWIKSIVGCGTRFRIDSSDRYSLDITDTRGVQGGIAKFPPCEKILGNTPLSGKAGPPPPPSPREARRKIFKVF